MGTGKRKFTAPPSIMENVDRMQYIREVHGMTRRDIAGLSGIRIEYIAQYERGYCYPSKPNYNKLAKVFNLEKWE